MNQFIKKYFLELIAVIIAVGALIVSIRSCQITKIGNEQSKNQYISTNRPNLIFKAAKFKDINKRQ